MDLFCGRYPSKAVRAMARDRSFMSDVLKQLPGVDPSHPAVTSMVAGLAGGPIFSSAVGPIGPVLPAAVSLAPSPVQMAASPPPAAPRVS